MAKSKFVLNYSLQYELQLWLGNFKYLDLFKILYLCCVIADDNECESDPCQNSGTCIDGENSFHCECELFTGDLCQYGKFAYYSV